VRRGLQPRQAANGRVAILALDLISDFDFPDGNAVRRALTRRGPAVIAFLARMRAAGAPVVYVNDNIGPWRSDSRALIEHCRQAAQGRNSTLIDSLAPVEEDFIVLKPRHSAFFGSPLVALLDDQEVDTVILLGVSAESCVWMTACDAHTRGFRLVVPIDTMAGASTRALNATIGSLRNVLGARTPARAASLRVRRGKLA
jgi:nicotinamidase-related amidase